MLTIRQVKGSASSVSLTAQRQIARNVPFPLLSTTELELTKESSAADYTYYSGSFSVTAAQVNSTSIDISAVISGNEVKSIFQKISSFGLPTDGGDDDDDGDDNETHPPTTTTGAVQTSQTSGRYTASTTGTNGSTTVTGTTSTSGGHGASPWTDWPEPSSSATNGPKYPTGGP